MVEKFLFLGILHSSGSLKSKTRIEFQTKRKELAEIIYSIAKEFTKPKIKEKKFYIVSVVDKDLNKKLGVEINKTRLPLDILDNRERKINFLKGYFEGKSSISPRKNLIKVSGEKRILEQLRVLLEEVNINARRYKTGRYYSLYIEGKNKCRIFRDKINFISKEKKEILERIVSYYR